jgi:hypothetical protein
MSNNQWMEWMTSKRAELENLVAQMSVEWVRDHLALIERDANRPSPGLIGDPRR